jgi:hypothetical protein
MRRSGKVQERCGKEPWQGVGLAGFTAVADDSIYVQKETTVSKWGNSLAVRIPQSAGRA